MLSQRHLYRWLAQHVKSPPTPNSAQTDEQIAIFTTDSSYEQLKMQSEVLALRGDTNCHFTEYSIVP